MAYGSCSQVSEMKCTPISTHFQCHRTHVTRAVEIRGDQLKDRQGDPDEAFLGHHADSAFGPLDLQAAPDVHRLTRGN